MIGTASSQPALQSISAYMLFACGVKALSNCLARDRTQKGPTLFCLTEQTSAAAHAGPTVPDAAG